MTRTNTLEFFFDIGSPYSYLASSRVDDFGERLGLTVHWRPFLLGGVFKATNNMPPASNPTRAAWLTKDLADWSGRLLLPFSMPSRFPLNTLLPQRLLTAVSLRHDADTLRAAAHALFKAYWSEDADVSDVPTVQSLLTSALDADTASALLEATREQDVKDALRATTDEAVARGAFGAPTFFIDDDTLFFGNDRLEMLAWHVENTRDSALS